MHLTPITVLSPTYTAQDLSDLAHLALTTHSSSALAILRYGKIPHDEHIEWLNKSTKHGLDNTFSYPRISSESHDSSLQTEEYLVVRDLDLPQTSPPSENTASPAPLNHTLPSQDRPAVGRIISSAQWRFHPAILTTDTPRSSSPQSKPPTSHSQNPVPAPPAPPATTNTTLVTHVNTLVDTALATLISGKPCYELRLIATLAPSHLRHGIAKGLVNWIFPFADRDQVPVILSASPVGWYLYRACGFVEITRGKREREGGEEQQEEEEVVNVMIDMGEWGGEGVHRFIMMVRWPEGWQGRKRWEEYTG